ncbi:hypothetical protein H6P81_002410 [Aristolochia fimbriata]|uniref:Uncharacterized protein n=1 Tax=Aristolochia fimbriata TaxID=158543 RepID=A0AAV7FCW8_ARIFI|nr:hypothetical protein H6P81_002410 [Aristolochia fimbriata]
MCLCALKPYMRLCALKPYMRLCALKPYMRLYALKPYMRLCALKPYMRLSADEEGKDEETESQGPNAVERAIGLTLGPWDTVRSWVNLVRLHLRPPDSNVDMDPSGGGSGGKKVRDAAAKSMQTAENAAEAAGNVIHKTVEKVKRSVLDPKQTTAPSAEEDL